MGKVLRFGRIVGFPYLTLTKSKLAPNLWIVIPFVASLIDPLTRNWNSNMKKLLSFLIFLFVPFNHRIG